MHSGETKTDKDLGRRQREICVSVENIHQQPGFKRVGMQAARETRQIYQDHYFLTDPDKFIFEFFPLAAEHQFLEHPITRDEFEQLPLLRSTFFHFGLGLARSEGLVQVRMSISKNTSR